jgi:glycosyltransferase involved in cell wall biosynthesis
MKVALVHDYIKEYGGAERVLEALHELYPDAPVYTSVYLPEFLGPHKLRFATWDIRTTWLQKFPFKSKLISPFRLLAPFAFSSLDLSNYDVVIVSATGAYESNMIGIKNHEASKDKNHKPVQICYCHTPPRYLYGYATAREWKKNRLLLVLGELANHVLRIVDFKASQHVNHFIANSEEVVGRIKKFYRRDSTVIYPPVDINSEFKVQNSESKEKTYFLAGGRLARPKNIALIVEAFTKLNWSLKVFGKDFAGHEQELKKMAGKNIEFVGEVTDAEKLQLMANAKAFVFASKDEDFGITPVEAMSVGTPVIAYYSGGVKESVVQDKTGVFFDTLAVGSMVLALNSFATLKIKPEDCIKQAQKFSKERFKKEIEKFVRSKL